MNKPTRTSVSQVFDVHIHPIRSVISYNSLIDEMNRSGITKGVILALDLEPEILNTNLKLREEIVDDLWAYSYFINPEQLLESMTKILMTGATTNQLVAEICNSDPSRFIGFGSVNPSKGKKYVNSKLEEIIVRIESL